MRVTRDQHVKTQASKTRDTAIEWCVWYAGGFFWVVLKRYWSGIRVEYVRYFLVWCFCLVYVFGMLRI